jgi:CO/xanthine dehydrogenase Mo-binding subunit
MDVSAVLNLACLRAAVAAAATWRGTPVAVKIITHSSTDETRISQELALSLSFDHPNLVRALHYAKLRVSPGSDAASLVSDCKAGFCAVSSLHDLAACATGAVLLVGNHVKLHQSRQ